jgi:hypothetical protein
MDEKDLFWLAGLLEGEGSFQKPTPCEPNHPRITINMTDYDVVKHVAELFEVKYIHTRKYKVEHWKDSYATLLKGKRAVRLMFRLYPLMGERRKQQIEAAIDAKPTIEEYETTDENWFFWIAGLLEGEGYFHLRKRGKERSEQPHIYLKMTDEDIVKRYADSFNITYYGPYTPSGIKNKSGYKPFFEASLLGAQAIKIMQQLRPFMSNRR